MTVHRQHDPATPRSLWNRYTGFAALSVACVLVAAGYTLRASQHRAAGAADIATVGKYVVGTLDSGAAQTSDSPSSAGGRSSNAGLPAAANVPTSTAKTTDLAPPLLLAVQGNSDVLSRHSVAVASLDDVDGQSFKVGMSCERVYYAGGQGICLTFGADPSTQSTVRFFDAGFHILHSYSITGFPSRARVSPDGRYGAITVFVLGDSYAASAFSTRTTIFDMHAGKPVANLEDFTVTRNGSAFQAQDFNFWGVTFAADGNSFYATLGTGGTTYLVRGDLAARTAKTLAENVECPSLSPDNLHIAFKRRIVDGPHPVWHPFVMDVATLTAQPLAETRNMDDQIEWLDNSHVLYGLGTNVPGVWEASIDDGQAPSLFASGVLSPSVIR